MSIDQTKLHEIKRMLEMYNIDEKSSDYSIGFVNGIIMSLAILEDTIPNYIERRDIDDKSNE